MISSYKPDTEFYTPERCHIVEIHNREEDKVCSVARARVEPGVTTKLHSVRGTVERYVILEGRGRVEVGDDEPVTVQPLDVVTIPAGVSQRITNLGDRDLIFLCICTPRFMPDCYVDEEGS